MTSEALFKIALKCYVHDIVKADHICRALQQLPECCRNVLTLIAIDDIPDVHLPSTADSF